MPNKQTQSEQTLIQSLNKVMGEQYINYRGKIVMLLIGGYRWGNRNFNSKEKLDQAIDEAELALGDSIKKGEQ